MKRIFINQNVRKFGLDIPKELFKLIEKEAKKKKVPYRYIICKALGDRYGIDEIIR